MKIIIVGRSGSGKTRIAETLSANGLRLLETTTTRPCRGPEDRHYKFITPEQSAVIPASEKLFPTTLNGCEYFTTMADIESADVMILDPVGVRDVVNAMPDTAFIIVNMLIDDEGKAREMAVARAEDPATELDVYNARRLDEEAAFAEFDKAIGEDGAPGSIFPGDAFLRNCQVIATFLNTFEPGPMDDLAAKLLSRWKAHNNMALIVDQCVQMGVLKQEQPGSAVIWSVENGQSVPHTSSIDNIAEMLLAQASQSGNSMSSLLTEWLSHDLTIGVPPELIPD